MAGPNDASSPHALFPRYRQPILGAPQGDCQQYPGVDANILCLECGAGAFCTIFCCKMAMEEGTHVCVDSGVETTAHRLKFAVVNNRCPTDPDTFRDFYLLEGNMNITLNIYKTLFVDLGISPHQLNMWKAAGAIHDNIVRTFNKYPLQVPVARFDSMMMRGSIIFIEETQTELLNVLGYLTANGV